ncbi:MAG: penicillin-binding protein, partial [Vicinamibacteraceae bacterium]
ALTTAYAAVGKMFTAGSIAAGGDVLAMNMPMDRDADHWTRDFASLKASVGTCDTTAPITPTAALSGRFTWTCERGRVSGSLLLAPTRQPRIQALDLSRTTP